MATVLQLENCYSWLYSDNKRISKTLWKALRFKKKGYFHTRLYKQKLWDGYVEFFRKESGRFLTGLLPEIEKALKILEEKYQVVDKRTQVEFRYPEIDDQFLNQWLPSGGEPVTLYDYQVALTNRMIKYHRGVIQAPTAAGKTFIMISLLKALPQSCPTLILANRKSLVEQNYDEMMQWGFDNVGRLYDKYNNPQTFTCATVQSLHKYPGINKVQALVVDEIHENMSDRPKKFFNKMKSCSVRAAVSATPFKFGGTDNVQKYSVKGYFGPRMEFEKGKPLTTAELQERGNLSGDICTFYHIDEPQIPYEVFLDAVTLGIAENWHFHKIVTRLTKKLDGRILILVDRIAHGDTLSDMIPGSLWVRGKDDLDTRKYVINQLKVAQEKTVAIATQQIFNAGINVKTHHVINAAGGKADHQIVQRIGRGLRTAADKEILYYWDFIFRINEYLESHSRKRVKILREEGHEVIIKDEIDF
ncbi:MAG: DEAD/DEAH box helicase [Candidatus Hermodarchaeia archaeon]|jgi:superfamily II DNA or RNA helicase